ncbi:MAG: transpeptidase family protein [Chlorobi bacterium]|nr:transpeptidase family protein [Chlorobiota bacterium]
MEIRRVIITRLAVIYFIMFIFGIVVVFKLAAVQNIKTGKWKQIAENLSKNTVIVEANRGNICADDGNILATSVPGYFVRIDLAAEGVVQVYDKLSDSLAFRLSGMFKDKSKAEYKRRLDAAYKRKNRGFLLTPRKIDYLELREIKKFPILNRGQNRGGRIIEQENKRIAPLGILASRTIGTLNKGIYGGVHGNIGYTGIEGAYETYLKGKEGISYKQNLSGRWVTRTEIEPQDGMDIITTLNIKMQDIAETALLRQLEKSQAEWGTAVLMEVKTGKIKAIANLGRVREGLYGEIYNYALGHAGCYEPGSTFKLMSLMAAMDQGLVDTSDVFDTGNGVWKYKGQTIYDSDYKYGGHGKLTLKEIFEKSSNVGVAKIITQCYEKRPKDYVDRLYGFRLNKPLGLEIKGEGIPYFKYPGDRDWWGTSLAWMSYGYEIKMTPLQILTFYNAVANNGKMVKPLLVDEILDGGQVVKKFNPEVINPMIVSRETIGKAQKLLAGVCESGTGKSLQNPFFKIAGKTGTAQISANGEYPKGLYLASFAGYFPADNPVYSMIVTMNRPKGVYYGSSVAGPVFKEIAEKVYALQVQATEYAESDQDTENSKVPVIKKGQRSDIKKVLTSLEMGNIEDNVNSNFVSTANLNGKIGFKEEKITMDKIPDVTGMGLSNAIFILERAGLKVKVNGIGKVTKQSLTPGSKFHKGQRIYLTLS